MKRLLPDGFVLVILAAVLLASVLPARGGFAVAVAWASTITITLLFFLNGARLTRRALLDGLVHWRLHVTILATTFVLFPLLGVLAERALPDFLPPKAWLGVIFLVVLPSTIQSSIAFTTVARGNVAGAVTSAAFSNIFGLVLTPVLLTLLAGTREAAPSLSAIWSIVSELLLPFVIGHLMRPLLISWIERHKRIVTLNDRGTIVLAVYSAFSSAVVAGLWHIMPPGEIAKLALVCAVLLTSGLCLSAGIATLLGFSREDCIAIMFCGSKKTLASGVPMARVLFPVADVGVILLPIMIYHQIQLMVCASIASRLGRSAPVGEGGAFDPA